MANRYVKSVPKTVGTLILGERYPKLVILGDSTLVIAEVGDETELSGLPAGTPAIEPSEDLTVVLGVDFDTCIFLSNISTSLVVKRKIPASVLSDGGLFGDASPILTWTNAFEISSKVYRTNIYPTGFATTDFTLIAQIPGTVVPGGTVSYTDSSISLADETESVSYFISNRNGSSNIVEFTGAVNPIV